MYPKQHERARRTASACLALATLLTIILICATGYYLRTQTEEELAQGIWPVPPLWAGVMLFSIAATLLYGFRVEKKSRRPYPLPKPNFGFRRPHRRQA